MEEKFTSIFKNFSPELTSDERFMYRLERRFNDIDFIKNQIKIKRKHSLNGLAAAAISGFIFGLFTAWYYPNLSHFFSQMIISVFGQKTILAFYDSIFCIIVLCLIGLVLVYTVYDITIFSQERKKRNNNKFYYISNN